MLKWNAFFIFKNLSKKTLFKSLIFFQIYIKKFNQKVKLYLANRAVLLMLNKNSQKHTLTSSRRVVMRWQHM